MCYDGSFHDLRVRIGVIGIGRKSGGWSDVEMFAIGRMEARFH